MLELRFLGQFDVRLNDQPVSIPARPAQSLLAYLALTAGTMHRREKLAGQFWLDATESNARSYLRHELWRIRKALTKAGADPDGFLIADDIAIGFEPQGDYWLDAREIQSPSGGQSPLGGMTPPLQNLQSLISSLSLYRGELLPGLYDDWVTLERERVQVVFESKMTRLLDALRTEERWADIIEWGERWIALGHTPEEAYRAVMQAHAALGNRAQAAAVYQRAVEQLERDLNVEPSPETQALYQQVLAVCRRGITD